NDARPPEQRPDFFGGSTGGYIKVFGFKPGDQIAYGPANNIGIVAVVFQDLANFGRMARHETRVYAMHIPCKPLRPRVGSGGSKQSSYKTFYRFFNHEHHFTFLRRPCPGTGRVWASRVHWRCGARLGWGWWQRG